jgi:phenylacetate-CoA ligase
VEEVLGCRTICEYGCSEVGIIAFECPHGGLHLSHESLICEFIKDGRPARPGEEAELVVTNLNDFATPLVRYAVGDTVVVSDAVCACGRTLPMIAAVGGRSHAVIVTPAGGTLNGLFFTHLFDTLPAIRQFRVIQERIDMLRIELYSAEAIPESTRSTIQSTVTKAMGDGVTIQISQVAELPLSHNGKFQWIVSHLNN